MCLLKSRPLTIVRTSMSRARRRYITKTANSLVLHHTDLSAIFVAGYDNYCSSRCPAANTAAAVHFVTVHNDSLARHCHINVRDALSLYLPHTRPTRSVALAITIATRRVRVAEHITARDIVSIKKLIVN